MADQKNPLLELDSQILEETELKAVSEYWTTERMESAIPIRIEPEDIVALNELIGIEEWSQEDPLTIMEPIPPELESDEDEMLYRHSEIEPQHIQPLRFNTRRVGNLRVLPYAPVGKMFMTFNGKNYVGSAWVIARRAVFTAGHCIFSKSEGGWADKVLFVPQYSNGSAPLGRWTATELHSLKGWTNNGDFTYDMGAFVVNSPIQNRTGSLGWMANYPPNQGPYNAIGYPASPITGYNFNGAYMWHSIGNYVSGGGNKKPIRMHNNMTGGCSGGPWVVKGNYANGLNSFRYRNQPNFLYSPYFGNGIINLYNVIKNK